MCIARRRKIYSLLDRLAPCEETGWRMAADLHSEVHQPQVQMDSLCGADFCPPRVVGIKTFSGDKIPFLSQPLF